MSIPASASICAFISSRCDGADSGIFGWADVGSNADLLDPATVPDGSGATAVTDDAKAMWVGA